MRHAVLFTALLSACATADADPYSSLPTDAARDSVATETSTDSAAVEDTGAPTEDTATSADTGPCKLVINEVQTGDGTSGNADFIELYNGCGASTSLKDYKLVYRSSSGTTDTVLFTFGSVTLAGKGFHVLGGTAFSGSKDSSLPSGLAVGGSSVGLRDASGALIDSMGYGSATGMLVEGTAPAAPGDLTPAKSLARKPDGVDTDNNASDFKVSSPTPGAAN